MITQLNVAESGPPESANDQEYTQALAFQRLWLAAGRGDADDWADGAISAAAEIAQSTADPTLRDSRLLLVVFQNEWRTGAYASREELAAELGLV